ncbi:MAG: phosphatase domain-containing protein, partial [Bdellovibrionota bacterium]
CPYPLPVPVSLVFSGVSPENYDMLKVVIASLWLLFTLGCASSPVELAPVRETPWDTSIVVEAQREVPAPTTRVLTQAPLPAPKASPSIPSSSLAAAKSFLLISDVDDTIRQTHVLDRSNMSRSGLRTDRPFAGMAALYASWTHASSHPGNGSRTVSYVSGAPYKRIQSVTLAFLRKNGFPEGDFFGRNSLGSKTHAFKVEKISQLIEANLDSEVILIGDNGEYDPAVFGEITRRAATKHPNLRITSFIRQAYNDQRGEEGDLGMEATPEQIVFASAADLALRFYERRWIGERELGMVLRSVKESWDAKMSSVFPEWVGCRAVIARRPLPSLPVGSIQLETVKLATIILDRTREYCERSPLDD